MEECKTAFKKGFADALEIELVEYNLTQEQIELRKTTRIDKIC